MTEEIEQYIAAHIDPEPLNLERLNHHAQASLLYGHMCSGHVQGRLLRMLTLMIRPKRVVELGAYVGYSALCIAQGLPQDGVVHTIEIDDEMEPTILNALASDPCGDKVRLHIGDAIEVLPTLPGGVDMAVIDANKRHYLDYYEALLPMMNPGGFILADNTLWAGKVADTDANRDAMTAGIAKFNDFIAADQRVDKVILPVRDGLTIIRVRP